MIRILKKILFWIIFSLPFIFLIYAILLRIGFIQLNHSQQPHELIADMDIQKKYNPQDNSVFFKDSTIVRTPPEFSIPKNATKYRFHQVDYELAEKKFNNPFKDNEYMLQRGKNRFEVFCSPCHGFDGKGNGTIITLVQLKPDEEGFPQPADLTSELTIKKSDERLFHILSAGQNLMFPVNFKLSETERWAVVNYIRKLQKENK